MERITAYGIVGLHGLTREAGGFKLTMDNTIRFDLPASIGPKEIEHITRDLEHLATKMRNHPTEMADLLKACLSADMERARAIATRHDITEEQFSQAGGGLIWLIAVGVGLAILLYPSEAR
jgi:hypothetical protein